jgi:predicted transcriptional regulator
MLNALNLSMKMATTRRTVRIRDVMTPTALTLTLNSSVADAARLFTNANIGGAPVVDDGGRVVGVLSKSDIIERSPFIPHSPRARISEAMTREALTLRGSDTAMSAVRLMLSEHVHRVVVIGADEKPIGIVSTLDILQALARGDPLQEGDEAYEERKERHGEPARAVLTPFFVETRPR